MSLTLFEGDFKIQAFLTPQQKINETPVGVRVTHIPTGKLRECYKYKTFHDNKKGAYEKLKYD